MGLHLQGSVTCKAPTSPQLLLAFLFPQGDFCSGALPSTLTALFSSPGGALLPMIPGPWAQCPAPGGGPVPDTHPPISAPVQAPALGPHPRGGLSPNMAPPPLLHPKPHPLDSSTLQATGAGLHLPWSLCSFPHGTLPCFHPCLCLGPSPSN